MPALQLRDPVAREPAVGLDLGLAGPRVPIPPPSRSRWVHRPRMRARLYSSCASSTWSLPSAEAAWSAKMSRMIAVRSITGHAGRLLEVALLARQQLVVAGDQVGVRFRDRRLQLRRSCPCRSSRSGRDGGGAGPAPRRPRRLPFAAAPSARRARRRPLPAAGGEHADAERPLARPRIDDACAVCRCVARRLASGRAVWFAPVPLSHSRGSSVFELSRR